jgi:hypothetical protein
MIWYVAIVALFNLALGYALAVFLRNGGAQLAFAMSSQYDSIESVDDAEDEDDWDN